MAQSSDKSIPEKAKDTARKTASAAAQSATDKVEAEAETARDTAAEETQKAADAAQAAADEFDAGSMQAQAIEQVAQRIDDLAAQIRNTDLDRMARTVGDAARRNPMLFVAGAAAAGFAVTRFLKARDPQRRYAADHNDPWSDTGGYGSGYGPASGNVPPSRGGV